MADLRWNFAAFKQVRLLPAVQADVTARAERMAAACGDGFIAVETVAPRNRSRAAVIAATGRARNRAAADNTLTRNIDAARR